LAIVATVATLFAVAFMVFVGNAGAEAGGTEVLHGIAMKTRAGTGNAVTNSLITYHGGPVSTTSRVYIDYWGSQWASGFTSGSYTSAQAQTYVQGFFNNVGGSTWHAIDTQYCKGAATGATTCTGVASSNFITNLTGRLGGTCVHNVTLPRNNRITQSAIASEAVYAMTNCFGGYDANAIYLVFTPSGHSMSGFGTQWCAWHSSTTSGSSNVAYGYIPFMPDAGSSCGINFVNGTNNSYGNGYFDGFSIVAGHEFVEAESDMWPGVSTACQGPGGGSDENADKCAWNQNGGHSANILLADGHNYAVQPNWSNATTQGGSHCVTSYP